MVILQPGIVITELKEGDGAPSKEIKTVEGMVAWDGGTNVDE